MKLQRVTFKKVGFRKRWVMERHILGYYVHLWSTRIMGHAGGTFSACPRVPVRVSPVGGKVKALGGRDASVTAWQPDVHGSPSPPLGCDWGVIGTVTRHRCSLKSNHTPLPAEAGPTIGTLCLTV